MRIKSSINWDMNGNTMGMYWKLSLAYCLYSKHFKSFAEPLRFFHASEWTSQARIGISS